MINWYDFLALLNDVLQSAIVVFGASIVLYNLPYSLTDRVTRAFTALVGFVIFVYLIEILVTHTNAADFVETWLRVEWFGIAMVPAAMFHLSDAILGTTGQSSPRRRWLVRVFYLVSAAFIGLALFTDWLVFGLVNLPRAPHLVPGPAFFIFTAYSLLLTGVSAWLVWRARSRAIIQAARVRLTITLGCLMVAPLAVYPYLLLTTNSSINLALAFWLLLVLGNLLVGFLFGILTLQIVYFATSSSPERVVRVRLYKYLARVPLAATLVLVAYILVQRNAPLLGLSEQTAAAFTIVAAVILVEWVIHTFKRPLERIFQLDHDPDVRRIQQLSERILTTRELHDFLEGLLTTSCNSLGSPAAFVVAFTPAGPRLEKAVGQLIDEEAFSHDPLLVDLFRNGAAAKNETPADGESEQNVPQMVDDRDMIQWQDFWLRPLYDHKQHELLGILGLRQPVKGVPFTASEQQFFDHLVNQVAIALEDRFLQQQVFAAVEGLMPQITAFQQRRVAAAAGEASLPAYEDAPQISDDPGFSGFVKDALSHYWGGPKLSESPLLSLHVVQEALESNDGNATKALRDILERAIEQQRPGGDRSWTSPEWILYNILELKFVEGRKVRDVARRLAMSESDLYRKQRVAIENVAKTILDMEKENGDLSGGD